MGGELVSGRIRTKVREILVGWTLAEIGDLFGAEGFRPDLDFEPTVGGQRRAYVEQFYCAIDWTRWDEVRRFLRAIEGVIDQLDSSVVRDPQYEDFHRDERAQLLALLRRDGYELDDRGALRARWEVLTQASVQALPGESAIPGHLRRMWDAVEDRPEQAISAAKDAIESTAKHALETVGVELSGREKFPHLIDRLQKELKLHPTTVAPDRKGADAIIPTLGSLATIANKVDEIRNLYGDGHGRVMKPMGLTARHARLVARCADAYVGMVLDTLEAPGAPWRDHGAVAADEPMGSSRHAS